ncbi:hypothetical protein BSZ39_04785 [Bowdeniella nasicola]|uniref:Sec-independent protein translocase protein TatA n=1 Tax=Bowdeniella nasicola TaxID=208480 RepID=A0A1Q5Q3C9_9ACTO|nr:Sec-independent protein translocase subunit TatA [Bowdeniella nasicola]OKL54285.1 hypothetical protein BSZ39_04785 [Bowdeniella nasicola]
MPNLRPMEIIIILLVIIVIFGAAKLPNIAQNVGKSMKVFKKEVKELREDDDDKPTDPYQATGGVKVDPQPYTPPQQPQQQPQQPQQGGNVDPNSPLS